MPQTASLLAVDTAPTGKGSVYGGAYIGSFDLGFILAGNAEPTSKPLSAMKDALVIGALDSEQADGAQAAELNRMVTLVQSLARRRAVLRRYRLHTERMEGDLADMLAERSSRNAVLIQKCSRRMMCMRRYQHMRATMYHRQQIKTGGKGGAGSGAKAVLAKRTSDASKFGGPPMRIGSANSRSMEWKEGIASRNLIFVVAMRALFSGSLDEAKHSFESFSQAQGAGGDKVALRMARVIEGRLRKEASRAAGSAPQEKKKAANTKGKAPPRRK